ncbi:uncharacterized protein METZ01_LOCUS1268 [marine metagenome]|uniref:Uncharacterized protein n=1 Tax=marine metagenome TaxID=408172 RepID=A0A381N2Y5_9ZZZZ
MEPDPDHAGAGKRRFFFANSAFKFPILPLYPPSEYIVFVRFYSLSGYHLY